MEICDLLSNYFVGCEQQLEGLSRCKGKDHVSYIKRLSITSLAQVLDSIRPTGTRAKDCSVLAPATTTTTTTTSSTGRVYFWALWLETSKYQDILCSPPEKSTIFGALHNCGQTNGPFLAFKGSN